MYYPMMMYPVQNNNNNMPMNMPMPMPMPMPSTTQEGDKKNQQQPMIYMMPVCFCDPSKLPKDMKMPNMPNMQYPIFPYPMTFPQNTTENK